MSSNPSVKVISFYTLNTPYEQEIVHLQHSCADFNIPIEIEGLESRGSWEKNVALKPKCILNKLKTSKTPILWVDADGAFLQKPDFSQFEGVDFSIRFMQVFQDNPKHAINAATIFINQTSEAHQLVEKWVTQCEMLSNREECPPSVDQISLYNVLLENKTAKVLPLPVSYCKIFDMDTFFVNDDQVVIEQRQASRQLR